MLALLFSASSCQDNAKMLDPEPQINSANGRVEYGGAMTVLGRKLKNPYSVKNMQLAYQNLVKSKGKKFNLKRIKITPTHHYVRFLPKNDLEKDILQDKDNLTLFDMPLDYEFKGGDTKGYSQITWQYTVVPINYEFRNIQYEIIESLFLQDEINISLNSPNRFLPIDLWFELENEALRITGNLADIIDIDEASTSRRKKWYPSGTIRYEDNTRRFSSRILPLEGAKIIVKRWFKWKSTLLKTTENF